MQPTRRYRIHGSLFSIMCKFYDSLEPWEVKTTCQKLSAENLTALQGSITCCVLPLLPQKRSITKPSRHVKGIVLTIHLMLKFKSLLFFPPPLLESHWSLMRSSVCSFFAWCLYLDLTLNLDRASRLQWGEAHNQTEEKACHCRV